MKWETNRKRILFVRCLSAVQWIKKWLILHWSPAKYKYNNQILHVKLHIWYNLQQSDYLKTELRASITESDQSLFWTLHRLQWHRYNLNNISEHVVEIFRTSSASSGENFMHMRTFSFNEWGWTAHYNPMQYANEIWKTVKTHEDSTSMYLLKPLVLHFWIKQTLKGSICAKFKKLRLKK